jgi:hypothetical protein
LSRGTESNRAIAAFVAALCLAACRETPAEPPGRTAAPAVHPAPSAAPAPHQGLPSSSASAADTNESYRHPPAARVVAIGDIHGDLAAARRALRLAGAVNDEDDWIGGKLVVVQTGDEIDRGDDDRAVIDLFERLEKKARAAGGRVHALNGNHEVMNVVGDFRYVTRGAFEDFAREETKIVPQGMSLERFPLAARGRAAAFLPGGSYARKLAQRDAVIVVGDTVFVHGGVTADHARYGIGRFNSELGRWMKADGVMPALAEDQEGPLWTRRYSDDDKGVDCEGLASALAALSAKRMVVGHTPHEKGISSACGERVWRIDCGLAAYYNGPTEVLEIAGSTVKVLKRN